MIRFSLRKRLHTSDGEMLLDMECEIPRGRFITLFGPSGAGKTSVLRMLAGLMQPDEGNVEVNGVKWLNSNKNICLKPQQRKIGFVFQDYALFPNMTVKRNLEYALAGAGGYNPDIVRELMEVMELTKLQNRMPETLSGGQKQRVALARAMVRRPDILLLDEPLSALDETMRSKLQDYILMIHRKYALTTIMVSHDVSEVFKMSELTLVLENGKITKSGKPHEVFSSKRTSGKYSFTGSVLDISRSDVVEVVSVLVGSNVVKVIATSEETKDLKPGNKVIIASKAFNPLLIKIEEVS